MNEVLIPKQPVNLKIREKIAGVEARMRSHPNCLIGDSFPLKHSFADGMYVRELTVPAGVLTVTKIHKYAHPVFLMKGKVSILEEGGVRHVEAPHYIITPAGTKRIVYHHTEVVIVTVHATKEQDLEKIENEIISDKFIEEDSIEILEFMKEVNQKENV